MKSILLILKNIKSLLPYFLLVALYFFFINLESRNKNKINRIIEVEDQLTIDESREDIKAQLRIRIPVIPYKE